MCVFDIYIYICVCVRACVFDMCVCVCVQIADLGELSAIDMFCFSRIKKYIQAAVFETIDLHHKF